MLARRSFIKDTSLLSGLLLLKPGLAFKYKANSAVRVGIIGCGERGTAVLSSMSKNTNVQVVAMADLFTDKLQSKKAIYDQLNTAKGLAAVPESNLYQGSQAYLRLIENKEVDAVLISAPAYTHAQFLQAAVAAGKHVYCEKPVATDVAGCQVVERAGQQLSGKQSVVIGFQIRYATPYVEMVTRIQDGAIGDVVSAQLYYFSSGTAVKTYDHVPADEARIRNHYHYLALSGGILLDQGIHMLDVCNWALKAHPIQATGSGSNRGGAQAGDTWNNYEVLYRYPNDINVSFHSTQVGPQFGDVCARFLGTDGIAEAHYSGGVFINGKNRWDSGVLRNDAEPTEAQKAAGVFLSSLQDADANKEKAFINSIETGNYLNETASGAASTLTAILGREAAATGKLLTWDVVRASNQRLDPKLNLAQFDKK